MSLPPTATNLPEWIRTASGIVNRLRRGLMPVGDGPPPDPSPGQIYFDTTLNKHRGWDGSAWQNLY